MKKTKTILEVASMGGKASFKKIGKKGMSKIGKLGSEARWGKSKGKIKNSL